MSIDLLSNRYSYFSIPKNNKGINEDTVMLPFLYNGGIYFAIADGVGGNKYGEIASRQDISICRNILSNSNHISMKALLENIWNEYIKYININIEYINAATTFTICRIQSDEISIGHIGDCRVYIVYEGRIHKITKDHTLLNEITKYKNDEYKYLRKLDNIITSSFSYKEKYNADIIKYKIKLGSIIIICSDGIYKILSDNDILSFFNYKNTINNSLNELKTAIESRNIKDDCSIICFEI